MVSTFHGLELGKRGLSVAQTNINTTGHNIANANTEGYSRQKVNSSASTSQDVWTNGQTSQLGTGAQVDSIIRVRDRFLDTQHRDQSAALGEWSVREETLGRLEVAINEPSATGLNAAIDQLGAAWQDVQNNPGDASAQAVLKERAKAFEETAKSIDQSMNNIRIDLRQQKEATLEEAGSLMRQIGELNDSIQKSGSGSNDLQDKRDLLVGKLSEIVPVTVTDRKDGTVKVELPAALEIDENGVLVISKEADGNGEITVPGGKLAGIQKSISVVDGYQTELTATVKKVADANGLSTGTDKLFSADAEFTIGSLTANLAVSINLSDKKDFGTVQNDFRALVSKLGAQSQTAINTAENHEMALLATENRRQSVTGVSIDEEMANLIMFQHAYSAAARFITTTDEMLDTIINRMAN